MSDYAKGYSAGIKRVDKWKAEVKELRQKLADIDKRSDRAVTIEFLINSGESMLKAAGVLLEIERTNCDHVFTALQDHDHDTFPANDSNGG